VAATKQIQADIDATPFAKFLSIKVVGWDAGAQVLKLTMPMQDNLGGGAADGHMHGGVVGAFIDTAATFAVIAAGSSCVTANYRTDLVRPVVGSGLSAVASVRRLGRTLAIADVDVFTDDGKLAAVGRATFFVTKSGKGFV